MIGSFSAVEGNKEEMYVSIPEDASISHSIHWNRGIFTMASNVFIHTGNMIGHGSWLCPDLRLVGQIYILPIFSMKTSLLSNLWRNNPPFCPKRLLSIKQPLPIKKTVYNTFSLAIF